MRALGPRDPRWQISTCFRVKNDDILETWAEIKMFTYSVIVFFGTISSRQTQHQGRRRRVTTYKNDHTQIPSKLFPKPCVQFKQLHDIGVQALTFVT